MTAIVTLSKYISRQFVLSVVGMLAALAGLVAMFDFKFRYSGFAFLSHLLGRVEKLVVERSFGGRFRDQFCPNRLRGR